MTTMALDVATMIHALNVLDRQYLGEGTKWRGDLLNQMRFTDWREQFAVAIDALDILKATASTDYRVLNAYLQENGYQPQFRQFDGVGVVSLFDLLVEWAVKAQAVGATRYDWKSSEYYDYPAMLLPGGAVEFYRVAGQHHPLLALKTKSGDRLWLTVMERPLFALDLFELSCKTLWAERALSSGYSGAQVPMLDIDVQPDLSWMIGYETDSQNDGYHRIVQAFQKVRIRANETGARAQAMTGFATTRTIGWRPQPYTLDQPFLGFFTRAGSDVPLACFWADLD